MIKSDYCRVTPRESQIWNTRTARSIEEWRTLGPLSLRPIQFINYRINSNVLYSFYFICLILP